MAVVNPLAREVVFKVVYYGPGLGGKTSSLQYIHAATRPEHRGKMVSLATPVDRTLYFDYLPIRIPDVRGLGVRLQLFTVPGQVYYNATRKLVLTGSDAVVFVADSQRLRLEADLESLDNLCDNLREHGRELAEMPHVLQFNKRDLPEILPMEELARELNRHGAAAIGTVATTGEGIFESLQAVAEAMLRDFERRAPAEVPIAHHELVLPEGGLAEALRRAEGEHSGRIATPAPPPLRASGAYALGLPARAPGELAARALADRDLLGVAPAQNPLGGTPAFARPPPREPAADGDAEDPPAEAATDDLPEASEDAAGRRDPPSDEQPASEVLASPPEGAHEALPLLVRRGDAAVSSPQPAPPEPAPEGSTPFGFGALWAPAEQALVGTIEGALGRGDHDAAVLAIDQLVMRSLAAIAGQLGSGGDAPRDPAVVVLLLGLDGRRYLEFRALVREVRAGRPAAERAALLAYSFAIEIRVARDRC